MVSGTRGSDGARAVWRVEVGGKLAPATVTILHLNMAGKCVPEIPPNPNLVIPPIVVVWAVSHFLIILQDFFLFTSIPLLKHCVVYIVMKEGIKFNWSVDGGWSVWQTWGRCSVTCGNGVRNRARSCNNPVPQYGGNQCTGDATEIHFCHERSCPGVFYFDITRSCFCHGTYLLNTNVKVVTDWSSWMYHWTKC